MRQAEKRSLARKEWAKYINGNMKELGFETNRALGRFLKVNHLTINNWRSEKTAPPRLLKIRVIARITQERKRLRELIEYKLLDLTEDASDVFEQD